MDIQFTNTNKIKSCCFFGHRELSDNIDILTTLLVKKVTALIENGCKEFFLGGYGSFDGLCYKVVKYLKKSHPDIKLVYVHAYHPSTIDPLVQKLYYGLDIYDEVIYPEIETKPLRFAITYRNHKIIDQSDYCIFYVKRKYGGAYHALKYAISHKKKFGLLKVDDSQPDLFK